MKVLHPAAAALYQIAPSCSWLKTNGEYNIQKEDLWWNVILPVSLFCLITSPILPGACRERERMREEENRHFYCSVLLPCQDRSDHRELRLKHTHTQREKPILRAWLPLRSVNSSSQERRSLACDPEARGWASHDAWWRPSPANTYHSHLSANLTCLPAHIH